MNAVPCSTSADERHALASTGTYLPVIHRQRQGISQTDMAQRLGVSRRWLIEFEHARVPNPEFSTILSALTELGLSLDVRKTPQPAELYEW